MKVTFTEVPNPEVDPAGFIEALNNNFALVDATLELVVDRTVVSTMLSDLQFASPQQYEAKATVGNGSIDKIVGEPSAPVLSDSGDETEELTWTASVPFGGDIIVSYTLYRKVDAGAFVELVTVDSDTLEYEDTTVAPGIMYTYYVVASSRDGGDSDQSNNVEFTVAPDYSTDFTTPVLAGNTSLTWSPATYGDVGDAIVVAQAYTGTLIDLIGAAEMTTIGGTAVSTEQAKYGSHSLKIPGTTFGTDFLQLRHHAVVGNDLYLVFGGPFTMEGWFFFTSLPGNTNLFGVNFGAGSDGLEVSNLGKLTATFNGSAGFSSANGVITTGSWIHVAYTRDSGGVCRIFVNGTLVASAVNAESYGSIVADGSGGTFSRNDVGYGPSGGPFDMRGYIDQIVYRKSCKYTANFVPPLAPIGGPAEAYAIYRDNVLLAIVNAVDGLAYVDTTTQPNTEYDYRVYAYDADVGVLVSAPSNVITVVTGA